MVKPRLAQHFITSAGAVVSEKLRVLHCIPQLERGGAERQLRSLAPLLVQRGIDVALYSRFTPNLMEGLSAAGVQCIPISQARMNDPRLFVHLRRLIRRLRPNVLQSWLTPMDILAGVLRPPGGAWILSERSSARAYDGNIKDVARFWLGRKADTIVANSPAGAELWKAARDVRVIPNGVEERFFNPVRSEALAPIMADRTVLLSIARLTASKRIPVLLETVARLRSSHPNILLVLLGDGPDWDLLQTEAQRREVADHVFFAGHQKNVASWLAWADLFVSASAFEGQPNGVLEAAAAGVPLVISNIQGHRDAAGDAAVLVSDVSASGFADAIDGLLASAPHRASLIERGCRRAAAASFEAAADAYAEVYRQIAG